MGIEAEVPQEIAVIAADAWEKHEQSRPVDQWDQLNLSVLAGCLLSGLTSRDYLPQPAAGVYFANHAPVVELSALGKGLALFWKNSGIDRISFGTHPEYSGGNTGWQWLIINGSHPEGSFWQTNYRFSGSSVVKEQRYINGRWVPNPLAEILDQSDLNLVGAILNNMLETIESLQITK